MKIYYGGLEMDAFTEYFNKIDNPQHRERMEEVTNWVNQTFPDLETKVAWNQPMFTHHGTFIIAFGTSKKYLSIAPEKVVIHEFADDIISAGYDYTKELIRIPWNADVDYSLLNRIIEFNKMDKANCTTFWRK